MNLDYTIETLSDEKYGYDYLITILDYEIPLSKTLICITLPQSKFGKCIVDTMLQVGDYKYRFIELDILNNGFLYIDDAKYVKVDEELKEKANSILLNYPNCIKNSVLTEAEINIFFGENYEKNKFKRI